MRWIWVLIVGAIIGAVAGVITRRSGAMGWISNIIAGLVGSAIGEALLGHWGPQLAGMAIIPSLSLPSFRSSSCVQASDVTGLVTVIHRCGACALHRRCVFVRMRGAHG